MVAADDEVETTDDEADYYEPPHITRRRQQPPATRAPTGEWEKVSDPDAPRVSEGLEPEDPEEELKPLVFFVRVTADAKNKQSLCKISLPRSWTSATVGRLVELLARRAGVAAWNCHLTTLGRGDLAVTLPVHAAIARRETVELATGPPRVSPQAMEAQGRRRTFWVWGRRVDGHVAPMPVRHPGLGRHSVSRLALGDEHVAVVTTTGLVLTYANWGLNPGLALPLAAAR